MKQVLNELNANAMISIMIYCKQNGYRNTAADIENIYDFENFTQFKRLDENQQVDVLEQVRGFAKTFV